MSSTAALDAVAAPGTPTSSPIRLVSWIVLFGRQTSENRTPLTLWITFQLFVCLNPLFNSRDQAICFRLYRPPSGDH